MHVSQDISPKPSLRLQHISCWKRKTHWEAKPNITKEFQWVVVLSWLHIFIAKALKAMVSVAGFAETSEMHTPAHTSRYNLVFFAICCIFLQHCGINMKKKSKEKKEWVKTHSQITPCHSWSYLYAFSHERSNTSLCQLKKSRAVKAMEDGNWHIGHLISNP